MEGNSNIIYLFLAMTMAIGGVVFMGLWYVIKYWHLIEHWWKK